MRDKNLDSFNFCKNVESSVLKLVSQNLNDLRNNVIAISNLQSENSKFSPFKLRDLDKKNFIRLSILSWYLPEEVSILLRLELSEKIKYYSPDDRVIFQQLLKSKAIMLIFLQETSLWHTRDFFGNILAKQFKLDRFFRSKSECFRTKLKFKQRKRGYDDHGSRVEDHKKLPKYDWSLTELQIEIEEERQVSHDMDEFLLGFMGG